ncbi:hypothetical protein PO909_014298 [Leuciscus waleckii]
MAFHFTKHAQIHTCFPSRLAATSVFYIPTPSVQVSDWDCVSKYPSRACSGTFVKAVKCCLHLSFVRTKTLDSF